ncbi:cytochrome P450 [Massarina eburnea CBS 473.64]|uniref:Cytochrome P450 n=1 Tax=Massarina eburnea CBS 473.64 TaxID=1395130 RepID=A0A6A6RYM7_9PLEO|nr:cytochrome P450 [Massarina eburnea CBS 473.64]
MYTVSVSIVLFIVFAVYKLRNVGRRPANYPPGPPTLPILGNLHLMPKTKLHEQFKKWGDEYGPIYSLINGSTTFIVLNSDQAVKDLLDKRSNIYSSRPDNYIPNRMSGGSRIAMMKYGKMWRKIRSTIHEHLNINASKSYIPYQDLETRQLLVNFLDNPTRWVDHLKLLTNSLTTQMVFGFRVTDPDDEKMQQVYTGFQRFGEIFFTVAAQMMDCYPIFRSFPEVLMPIKRTAREHHEIERELYCGHWLTAKEKLQAGTLSPCMCVDLVASQKREGYSDILAGYITGTMLEGGSDTTWSELVGWMQAMVLFPNVARTAQEEIDRVCGDRLPSLEDESNMPYIRCCVKEALRFMPTVSVGIPHAVIEDDWYMGYKIPKGATVTINVWGIHNDPNRHPSPRTFDPTRYADDHQTSYEAAVNPDVTKRDHFLFGAGRRICAGMHIADRSMFLAISRLLWAFNFELPEGATTDPRDLSEGIVMHPRNVPVNITARSEERAEAIRKEWDVVEGKLDEGGQWKKVPEGMFVKQGLKAQKS